MKDVKEYMHSEVCEANVIHQDAVAKVRENMQDEDPIYEVAELFKVFGDSTRVRHLAPAAHFEARPYGEKSSGREGGVLFPDRRPYQNTI